MIMVTGDTHGDIDIDKLMVAENYLKHSNDADNYLIIAGDFGGIWKEADKGKINPNDVFFIHNIYDSLHFTTLWVDGNHENFDVINNLPVIKMFGGRVHKITDKCIHLIRGEVYTIQDKTFFVMGGAMSVDKHRRTPHLSWWADEIVTLEEHQNAIKNLDKVDWKVDYIVTHTAPNCIINVLSANLPTWSNVVGNKLIDPVSFTLQDIYDKIEFSKWFFGHFHVDKPFKHRDNQFVALFDKVEKL